MFCSILNCFIKCDRCIVSLDYYKDLKTSARTNSKCFMTSQTIKRVMTGKYIPVCAAVQNMLLPGHPNY